jgi:hypothetical protein
MELQRKVRPVIWLLIAILVLLAMIYPGYLLYQRITVDPNTMTQAELTVRTYAKENRIPFKRYPESIIALLERNPETETFVLEYPIKKDADIQVDLSSYKGSDDVPLFLQWDQQWGYIQYGSDVAGLTGCGPVCLSMAAWYLTEDDAFSPDKMIRYALDNGYYSPGNGSSWTLISEGGVKLGFDVTEIPLVESRIVKNLEVDNPIICAMGPGDFTTSGHYIVMVGYEDGMIRINDPNSIANSQKLWKYEDIEGQIRNLWVIRK